MFSVHKTTLSATFALILPWAQPAHAMQLDTDGSAIATRSVTVSKEALLGQAKAARSLDRQLFVAARNACEELYPHALVYVTHQCVSDAFQEARKDLNHLRARVAVSAMAH